MTAKSHTSYDVYSRTLWASGSNGGAELPPGIRVQTYLDGSPNSDTFYPHGEWYQVLAAHPPTTDTVTVRHW